MAKRSEVRQQHGDFWASRHLDDAYWNSAIHWGDLPAVAAHHNRLISGDPKVGFVEHTRRKYISELRKTRPKIKMLSLCCGIGRLELEMVRSGFCDSVVGYDASEGCVAQANSEAQRLGIADRAKFFHADLNTVTFPEGEQYDVILNEAALHHISGLEHLMRACRERCHADTIFVNHDYIGPNHHQWTDRQIGIINDISAMLPDALKASRSTVGKIHHERASLTLAHMLAIDPTEGVRSKDIIPVMKQSFEIVEYKEFGGSILHTLFNDIAGNFAAPEHDALVRVLIYLEEKLIACGHLETDFCYWVARPS